MSGEDAYAWLAELSETDRDDFVNSLSAAERAAFLYDWRFHAHAGQIAPGGTWRCWLIMAGRGFGKTRAGAEWVRSIAEERGDARIALIGASIAEARSVMVEGESGIIACSPPHQIPKYESSAKRLIWPNGAQAFLYSAAEPESLRGPQHSHAWCDEIGKWPLNKERALRCWDNMLMGLRLGANPRICATTTPRAVPLITRLMAGIASGDTALTKGKTRDNSANLPASFLEAMTREFAGTTLARQELDGELLDDIEGALWSRALLERCRFPGENIEYCRIIVAVDPPASSNGDACGIIVAALGNDGLAYVLADCSIDKPRPQQWARAAANAAMQWQADRIIAEANQGGEMVESVLRAASVDLPVKLVHASRGKVARAEPVAALYEAGRVRHVGQFAKLEDELCGLMTGGEYQGPSRSPDRADALVWALSELMLQQSGKPQILAF